MSPRKSLAVIFRPLVAVVLGSRPYQTCCLNCDHRREPCPLFKCRRRRRPTSQSPAGQSDVRSAESPALRPGLAGTSVEDADLQAPKVSTANPLHAA